MGRFRLGVLVGLRSEARTLVNASRGGSLIVEISGARPDLAQAGAARLVAAGCTHLLSFGLAGGLVPYLAPGDLVLPGQVVTLSGVTLSVDPAWHRRALDLFGDLAPATGAITASETAVDSVAAKHRLAATAMAIAVDMESHHLAAAAMAAGLPWLAIRAVADTAEDVLPAAALVGVTPAGDTALGAVLRSVLRHPGQIPALMRLGRAAGAAHRTLKRCDLLGGSLGFGLF
jgi:adenosylhomocysteine nucleosidase